MLRCEYEGEMLNIMPNFYSWMSGWMVVSFTKIENSMWQLYWMEIWDHIKFEMVIGYQRGNIK